MPKGLIIILDGLGDRPCKDLNGQTPLEAAQTPVMNRMLKSGSCGLVDPLYPGFPVDTHTGSAALMGVSRRNLLTLARGPVEAAGVGINMIPGDVFLRANFATIKDDGYSIVDRRAGRIREGTDELSRSLQDLELDQGVTASVFPATHHRAVVRLRGENLSAEISSTDPGSMFPGARLMECHAHDPLNTKAKRTADALNQLTRETITILKDHPVNRSLPLPANALLTRGAGMVSNYFSLLNRLGLTAAIVSGEKTVHGLGRLFGFEVINRPEFTASADTDLISKVAAVREMLVRHDIVYLHIKAPDIFSHSKDPIGKCGYLQLIDKALESIMDENLVVGITGDHSTDSNTGNHCGEPVPSLICAPGCRVDSALEFSERECVNGGLGRVESRSFLFHILDLMGELPNYHPTFASFLDGSA